MDTNLSELQEDAIAVHSGFPNPALDHRTKQHRLDLNQLLLHHPASTFLFQIAGHQWEGRGIFDGDIALIDRALEPHAHDLVISWQAGGFVIGRYDRCTPNDSFWGVISAIIHRFAR